MSGARPAAGTRLCALGELADPGARGFAFDPPPGAEDGTRAFLGFVVRSGDAVRGWVDACPHTGASLATEPDRYMNRRGDALVCWNHGAIFRPEDGLCLGGPCAGRSLRPWPVEVRDGEVLTA